MLTITGSVSSRECLGAAAILPTTEDCGRTETSTAGESKREKSSKRVQQILKSTNTKGKEYSNTNNLSMLFFICRMV